MEKVFDIHAHYLFDLPIDVTIDTFKEEFIKTGTEKVCFLSIPHETSNGEVSFDEMQNLKGLFLKHIFLPNAYAFAGLVHPKNHDNIYKTSSSFLSQAKEYMSSGYDGIKMLEGYPSLIKAWDLPISSPLYDEFYAYMEECGYPILMHVANPKECWDIDTANENLIKAGRVYDSTYPTKEEITAQVFQVLDKFPKLKLILAHFGFFSYDISEAERFFSYKNTMLDITPGGEQLINMTRSWDMWFPFWEKYQNRILYGTDFYAFPKDDNWEQAFSRRPKLVRQMLETASVHEYLTTEFNGISLQKSIRDKIYRDNFISLLGTPTKIDYDYLRSEAERLTKIDNKFSQFADSDLRYILLTTEEK